MIVSDGHENCINVFYKEWKFQQFVKNIWLSVVFSTLFSVFANVAKHGL